MGRALPYSTRVPGIARQAPEARAFPIRSVPQPGSPGSVACPTCLAPAGFGCWESGKDRPRPVSPHAARRDAGNLPVASTTPKVDAALTRFDGALAGTGLSDAARNHVVRIREALLVLRNAAEGSEAGAAYIRAEANGVAARLMCLGHNPDFQVAAYEALNELGTVSPCEDVRREAAHFATVTRKWCVAAGAPPEGPP